MPFYLVIKKYAKINSVFFYRVEDHLNKQEFYIGIDPLKKQVKYYQSCCFDKPIGVIDLLDTAKPPKLIPGINQAVLLMINAKSYKAIRDNYFPEDMSHICH